MIDPKKNYVFYRRKGHNEPLPDTFVSPLHDLDDALFEFIFQTLGYAILEVKTGVETSVEAKEV